MPEVLKYLCPFCNREARVGKPCPGCAKKAPGKKPWQQSHAADGLDLPNDSFDYEDFCNREFGKTPHSQVGLKWYWWVLALICLTGMVAGILSLR